MDVLLNSWEFFKDYDLDGPVTRVGKGVPGREKRQSTNFQITVTLVVMDFLYSLCVQISDRTERKQKT